MHRLSLSLSPASADRFIRRFVRRSVRNFIGRSVGALVSSSVRPSIHQFVPKSPIRPNVLVLNTRRRREAIRGQEASLLTPPLLSQPLPIALIPSFSLTLINA